MRIRPCLLRHSFFSLWDLYAGMPTLSVDGSWHVSYILSFSRPSASSFILSMLLRHHSLESSLSVSLLAGSFSLSLRTLLKSSLSSPCHPSSVFVSQTLMVIRVKGAQASHLVMRAGRDMRFVSSMPAPSTLFARSACNSFLSHPLSCSVSIASLPHLSSPPSLSLCSILCSLPVVVSRSLYFPSLRLPPFHSLFSCCSLLSFLSFSAVPLLSSLPVLSLSLLLSSNSQHPFSFLSFLGQPFLPSLPSFLSSLLPILSPIPFFLPRLLFLPLPLFFAACLLLSSAPFFLLFPSISSSSLLPFLPFFPSSLSLSFFSFLLFSFLPSFLPPTHLSRARCLASFLSYFPILPLFAHCAPDSFLPRHYLNSFSFTLFLPPLLYSTLRLSFLPLFFAASPSSSSFLPALPLLFPPSLSFPFPLFLPSSSLLSLPSCSALPPSLLFIPFHHFLRLLPASLASLPPSLFVTAFPPLLPPVPSFSTDPISCLPASLLSSLLLSCIPPCLPPPLGFRSLLSLQILLAAPVHTHDPDSLPPRHPLLSFLILHPPPLPSPHTSHPLVCPLLCFSPSIPRSSAPAHDLPFLLLLPPSTLTPSSPPPCP
ncbi:hypothetical protein C7M84_013767 [Penaeus vannamei]|uniref:Uncharacterized protein n=1 Tax=Penaeus vannamei TaxID=6689 RepID=A0A3R7Q470_PENVA|nr:hypothetical protein C7M84_013767 [Penaeus vannamei]